MYDDVCKSVFNFDGIADQIVSDLLKSNWCSCPPWLEDIVKIKSRDKTGKR